MKKMGEGVFVMAEKTLQDVIAIVEKQQKEIQMLRDVHEIQNFMGRYIYLHEINKDHTFPDTIYAQKTPGVSGEVAHGGVWLGIDGMKRMYAGMDKMPMKGMLFTHPLTTPVIEIAGDGKTAKGVWISPGYETRIDEEGKPLGCFCYTKYGCDFVKEDAQWKIWHYHVYRVFMTPWNGPFTEEFEKEQEKKAGKVFGMERKPDAPTTVHKPYSKDTERELIPRPPEPYETFEETFSYGPDN